MLCAYNLNSSKLEQLASGERHGLSQDEEEIVRVQKKSGKSGQCLCLLLVIFAIIASKLPQFYSNFSEVCMLFFKFVTVEEDGISEVVPSYRNVVCNSTSCSSQSVVDKC